MVAQNCNRTSDRSEDNRRGIRNVSRVSCHVACAVQILCHAIPTVRSALRRLSVEEQRAGEDNIFLKGRPSSQDVLLEELIDFFRHPSERGVNETNHCSSSKKHDDGEQSFHSPTPPAWNPQRLYKHLREERSSSNTLAIDPHNVGDATRSLSCLLRLLSHPETCGGPAWKALLEASVWEGETRQILEGRRRLFEDDEHNIIPTTTTTTTATTPGETAGEARRAERRFLQRIKPATKTKPMPSPLVLKFRPKQCNDAMLHNSRSDGESLSGNSSNWSVIEALNEIVEPQRMHGSSYPWDSLSPDTYSEHEIVCRYESSCDDPASSLGDHGSNGSRNNCSDSDSDSTTESESDTSSSSSSSGSDVDSIDDMDWITSKRIEITCIPRVWLLHLDRPRMPATKLRRVPSLHNSGSHIEKHGGGHYSLLDHVHVPLEIDPSSIQTAAAATTSPHDEKIGFNPHNDENDDKIDKQLSSMSLFLQGGIVQVVEVEDCGNDDAEIDDEDEGGHSVTLLRNLNVDDASMSWLLIDDEIIQPVSEERAVRMLGGVFESNDGARDDDNNSDKHNDGAYYAASLLVYSIANNNKEYWEPFQNDIVLSWREHKSQLAATIASQEELVGKRIRVKWAKGKFFPGTVTRYDPSTGKHRVTYDDGDVKDYNLAKKTIEWID